MTSIGTISGTAREPFQEILVFFFSSFFVLLHLAKLELKTPCSQLLTYPVLISLVLFSFLGCVVLAGNLLGLLSVFCFFSKACERSQGEQNPWCF